MKVFIGYMVYGMNDLDILEQIEWVKSHGFNAVGFHTCPVLGKNAIDPHNITSTQLEQLDKALNGFEGIEIHAPFSNYDICLTSPNHFIREASLKELSFSLRIAHQINASIVTIHAGATGAAVSSEQQRRYLSESLVELDKLAKKFQIRVALEVADFFLLLDRFVFVDELGLRNVGITMDIGHLEANTAYRDDFGTIGKVIRRFCSRIWHLHVHDYDGEQDHIIIGEGRINFDDVIRALKDIKYQGMLMLELDPKVVTPQGVLLCCDRLKKLLGRYNIWQ